MWKLTYWGALKVAFVNLCLCRSEESVAQMKSISSMADTVGSGRSTDTMKKKTSKMTASADEIVKANGYCYLLLFFLF